ncbi:MAG: hypothetical protein ACI9QQ_001099, partial [Myxococcota bacterium]
DSHFGFGQAPGDRRARRPRANDYYIRHIFRHCHSPQEGCSTCSPKGLATPATSARRGEERWGLQKVELHSKLARFFSTQREEYSHAVN